MDKLFITELDIKKVRHLKEIHVPLAKDKIKHLMFTGKNGSGKTSVLEAMAAFLNSIATSATLPQCIRGLEQDEDNLEYARKHNQTEDQIIEIERRIRFYQDQIEKNTKGVVLQFNHTLGSIHAGFESGSYVLAYYKDNRVFKAEVPRHIEKVELKESYLIDEEPRKNIVKYLRDLKMTEALAITNGRTEKADAIKTWFNQFQNLLCQIFDDRTLKLNFDEETFDFSIQQENREPFDFNALSSGYAAVLDIVVDLIMRMEKQTNRSFRFDLPGIVLIDEIETHLHLQLQKNIMPLLTTVFPNIQFIVTTHSPFVLNSIQNVVIYDLEKHMLVENGLDNVPYEGIVEGYFNVDKLSESLKEKFMRYKTLTQQLTLSDEELEEIARLELFLNEIPDYLALDIATEYKRLKLEFEQREDFE